MSNIKDRIESCNTEITRRKYAAEENVKKIKTIKDIYSSVIPKLNGSARDIVSSTFPEFLDEEYVNSLDTMSYDEQMIFKNKIDNLINVLLDHVEEFLR